MPTLKPESLAGPKPAKTAVRYTAAEKKAALGLYVELGPAEAGRRTGISKSTICNWARDLGLETVAADGREANIRAIKLKWEERRVALAERIGAMAEHALEVTEEALTLRDTRSARDAASTMATAVDKAQLLTGGPTERVGIEEKFTEREGEIEAARRRAREVATRPAAQITETATDTAVAARLGALLPDHEEAVGE